MRHAFRGRHAEHAGKRRGGDGDMHSGTATKSIDKSVYVLEKFLVHRARSRRPKGGKLLAFVQHSKGVNSRLAIGTYIGTFVIKLSDIL